MMCQLMEEHNSRTASFRVGNQMYCLFQGGKSDDHVFLHFGTDIPRSPHYRTMRIRPTIKAHESEHYLSLIGLNVEG
jgi:hypothetical protein